jgi:GMP synthase (glutamine-hydrolysing)
MQHQPYLILDCYFDEKGSAPNIRALLGGAPSETVRAVSEPLPTELGRYAGIIVTGSKACISDPEPWMKPVFEFLRQVAAERMPLLGICFGHQAIAAALGGPGAVRLAPRGELGWEKIRIGRSNALLEGLEPEFRCFLSHFDEVSPDIEGLEILASSERCAVQAYQMTGQPIWGVQFHPEMDPEESETLVRRNLERHTTLPDDPEAVLAGRLDGRFLGRRIVANFMGLCGKSS